MSTDEDNKNLRCEMARMIDYCTSCQMVDTVGSLNWFYGLCRRLETASEALHDGAKFRPYVREGHPMIIVREYGQRSTGD